ncbi:MAG: hypothetical protein Q9159_006036 [Coniocarpon cinnabarinum]
MDANVQKLLTDKLYEKRRTGALELEKLIRDTVNAGNNDRIHKIVDQLCHDFAYAVHQPYARNGGLIGLAAASIALGPDVAPYLKQVIPPVLACFNDQDARVRYYACESMYNIAKTCKGEILPYFNEVFDAMAKLAADNELSVKNGAELLDRLIKDIVSESATTYVSIVHPPERSVEERENVEGKDGVFLPTAFSLPRFIPLLTERVNVLNPYTRTFLVQWISILDSIPDLELVSYLPSFLGGLFRFLNDPSEDVVTQTQELLEKFLSEIKQIARVKKVVAENKLLSQEADHNLSRPQSQPQSGPRPDHATQQDAADDILAHEVDQHAHIQSPVEAEGEEVTSDSDAVVSHAAEELEDDFMPGQDVFVNHPRILEVVIAFLRDPSEHVQVTALRWIDGFFDISPDDIMPHVPELLNQVLPALSSDSLQVCKAATRVNEALMSYIIEIKDEEELKKASDPTPLPVVPDIKDTPHRRVGSDLAGAEKAPPQEESTIATGSKQPSRQPSPPKSTEVDLTLKPRVSLDYDEAVNALTQQFLNQNEATRAASLSWLLMLQKKAPRKVLAAHDTTFPALLNTLADTSDTVVTRDLQLLCQISKYSSDTYFSFFMVKLLELFASDRRLLETRGNLIIRQLCLNLDPERIYRNMAGCLENHSDPEFASTMVQNLNNNLITAPELIHLRKKLRYTWDSREGQTLFVVLFRAWCQNAISTVALCLLAQAYEQAYNLLSIFADIEVNVNMLIQLDKLVQLLESPVFTFLRLQLLEPDRHPHLYKTLYGILMLLPQSAAFAALKNRLNSVSAIGYLHVPQPPPMRGSIGGAATTGAAPSTTPTAPTFERAPSRLKTKDEGGIRWSDLLGRFREAQEKGRRASRQAVSSEEEQGDTTPPGGHAVAEPRRLLGPTTADQLQRSKTSPAIGPEGQRGSVGGVGRESPVPEKEKKSRFSAGRFGKVVGVRGQKR